MGKKRNRNSKTKSQHEQSKQNRQWGPMSTVVITAITLLGGVLLAVAGMIYATQKTPAIWLCFFGVVCFALAIAIHWQHVAVSEADNPPFVVTIESAIVGETRDKTQIYCEYNRRFLSPVPLVLFVRLVNNLDTPVDISGLIIDVKLQGRFWFFPHWLKTKTVSESLPLIWVNPPPTPSRRMEMLGSRLEPQLSTEVVQAHKTVRGWVLLDVSSEFDSAPRPLTYRISVKDTAGRRIVSLDTGPDSGDNLSPQHGLQTEDDVDLSGFIIKHLADWSN